MTRVLKIAGATATILTVAGIIGLPTTRVAGLLTFCMTGIVILLQDRLGAGLEVSLLIGLVGNIAILASLIAGALIAAKLTTKGERARSH